MSDTLEKKLSPDQVYDWLRAEAQARQIKARIHTHLAQKEHNFLLTVPVHIEGSYDAFDIASMLQDLEDAWNNQEPRPEWMLLLRPAAK